MAKDSTPADTNSFYAISRQSTMFLKDTNFGDMAEIFDYEEGVSYSVETSPPPLADIEFSFGAALNERRKGNSILESVFFGISKGGWYTRVETGGVKGTLTSDSVNHSTILRPNDLNAEAKIKFITFGKYFNRGLQFGFAYYRLEQPGLWTLSYKRDDSGIANDGVGTFPDQMIDKDYSFTILGLHLGIDNLKAIMKNQGSPLAIKFINTATDKLYLAWDIDLVWGLGLVKPGAGLSDRLNEATLSPNFPSVAPGARIVSGAETNKSVATIINYNLSFGYVRKVSTNYIALAGGINGRIVSQVLGDEYDLDDEPANNNEAHIDNREGDFAISWGPFVKLALSF